MEPRDVLCIVEFRRYGKRPARLARSAVTERGAQVVPVTGEWMSSVSGHAHGIMAMPIECGTAWDSHCAAVAMTEAVAARVADRSRGAARRRVRAWDAPRPQQDLEHGES